MRLPPPLVMACAALSMAACSRLPSVTYSRFERIGPDGMAPGWQYTFSPADSLDSTHMSTPVDIILAVRYSASCRLSSLPIVVTEDCLNCGSPDTLALDIPLFSPSGNPLGRGVYGIFEATDTLHAALPIPPGYTLSVSSALPQGYSAGIKEIGIVAIESH